MEKNIFYKSVDAIKGIYEELKRLPKPESYRLGGTFYGSKELFSSVGNHLELLEDTPYSSYDSYCHYSTDYPHMWGLKIGGAYSSSAHSVLKKFLDDNRDELFKAGFTIIDDYGTNFSTYGIAVREKEFNPDEVGKKKKFRVHFSVRLTYDIDVEADDGEEASRLAREKLDSVEYNDMDYADEDCDVWEEK